MNLPRASQFAVFAAAMVSCAGQLRSEIVILSGFDQAGDWAGHFIGTVGTLSIPLSGGNPGAFADLSTHLSGNTYSAAGFRRTMAFTLGGGSPVTSLTLWAEYRRISGVDAEFVPFLLQNGLVYTPESHLTLGESAEWIGTGQILIPLGEFSHPSGTPLSPNLLTSAGFFVRLRSETPTNASSRIGIDNLNIQLIPAPSAIAPLLAAGMIAARRQRTS